MKLSRHFITILIVGLAIWLIVPKLVGGEETVRVLSSAIPLLLVMAFLAQVLSWASDAYINRTLLSTLNERLPFLDLVRISSLEVFASHCLPIGGIGFSVSNIYFFRKRGLSGHAAFLLVAVRTIFVNVAFSFLFLISLAAVPTHPSLYITGAISGVIVFLFGLSALCVSVYFYFHREALFKTIRSTVNAINKLTVRWLRRAVIDTNQIESGMTEAYESLRHGKNRMSQFPLAFLSAIVYHLAGVGCLYFVFLSLGYKPAAGALLLGYFLPMFSVMITPGGLGLFEGLMSGIYLLYQFPRSETLMAVLIYRFFSFWLPIPLGFLSYLSLQYTEKPNKD